MRKVLGSTIFVVVVALIVTGVGFSLNSLARLPGTVTGMKTGTGSVTIHEDVFPFNPCTSDPKNTITDPNNPDTHGDPDFVALFPRYKQCSSSHDNYNWVWYSDPTISAPVNTRVTFEIYNYDSATPILNNYYTQPQLPTGGAISVQIPATTLQKGTSGDNAVYNQVTVPSASASTLAGTQSIPVAAANCSTKSASNCYAQYQAPVAYGPGSGTAANLNVPVGYVSHTFTIHGIASQTADAQPYLYVSVPISGAYADVLNANGNATTPADATAGMPLAPTITTFSFTTPSQPGDYVWQCFDPCGANYNGFGGPMSTKGYMSGTFTVTA